MTTDLTQRLAGLAEEAGNYADGGAAIAAAQRQRQRRYAVPVAGGLAAVLAAGVVAAHASGRGPTRPLPPASTARPALALPPVVTPPTGEVAPLPTDRAVGPGVLVYRPCPDTCPAYLVTASGTQYLVDVPHTTPDTGVGLQPQIQDMMASLSPDGRYLAITVGDTTSVRDLTGTATREEPIGFVLAWSPDDRYVVNSQQRLDTQTGATVASQTLVSGVTDTGQILTPTVDHDPATVTIRRTAPDGSTKVDATAVLHPGDAISKTSTQAYPGGGSGTTSWTEMAFGPDDVFAVTAFSADATDSPGTDPADDRLAFILGDTATGQVTRRVPLPPGASAPFFLNSQPVYALQRDRAAPIELYGVTPAGTGVLLSRLPAQAEYVVAGMHFAKLGPAYPDMRELGA